MKYNKKKFWTKEEEIALKEDYSKLSFEELELKYNRRSCAIADKAFKLNYSRNYEHYWKKEDEQSFIVDYPILSLNKLVEKYKRSINNLRAKANRLGIIRDTNIKHEKPYIPRKVIKTKEEIQELYYNGFSEKEIANIANVSQTQIRTLLKSKDTIFRIKKPKRIYEINEDFFNKIDTEEKAYILGFLYADGYNSTKKKYYLYFFATNR